MEHGQPVHGPLEEAHYREAERFIEQRPYYLTMTLDRDGSMWVQVWEVDDFGPARVWLDSRPAVRGWDWNKRRWV